MKPLSEIKENERIFNVKDYGIPNLIMAFVKLPDCGTCSFLCSDNENGLEHVSISPKHKFRLPSWDDMCILKDICWYDEEEVYQIMPKKSEYVNVEENCLHLWKPIGHELRELIEVSE